MGRVARPQAIVIGGELASITQRPETETLLRQTQNPIPKRLCSDAMGLRYIRIRVFRYLLIFSLSIYLIVFL